MNNAPFKSPYKKSSFSPDIQKLEALEKQLHFLDARVKELEVILLALGQDEGEDISETLGSADSMEASDEDVGEILKSIKKSKK